jgi:hypothetical protein
MIMNVLDLSLCIGADDGRCLEDCSALCEEAKWDVDKVPRNTLAVFTQPNLNEFVNARTGIKFGDHVRLVDEKHA